MDVKSNRERADRQMNWIEFRARGVIFLNCAPHRNAIQVYRWFRAIAVSQQRCDVSYNRNVYYNTHANCFALLISLTTNSLTLFLSLAAVPVLSRSCVGAPILLFYFTFFCCKNIENTDTAIVCVAAHTIPLNLPDLIAAAAAAAAREKKRLSEWVKRWESERRVKEKKQLERRQAFIISHRLRKSWLGVFFFFFCFLRIIYTGQLQCMAYI